MDNLARICSGLIALKVEDEVFFYSHPSPKLSYKADILVEDIISKNESLLTDDEVKDLMLSLDRWSEQKEKEVSEGIPKLLENLKIQIYWAFIRQKEEIAPIRNKIQKVKDYLFKLLSEKHKFDEYTIKSYAQRQRALFLIKHCVQKLDTKPEALLNPLYSSILSESDIRKVARSEAWSVKWKAMKNGCKVFSKHITEEQERLLKWTSIYDSIYEMESPPPDEVIEDDDALDGFFLCKKTEDKDKSILDEIEAKYHRQGKTYTELYLPAANMEEARRNDAQNTEQARRLKEQRFQQINKQGVVKEADLYDQRLKLDIAKNQMEMGR